jgi:hypothetical protein
MYSGRNTRALPRVGFPIRKSRDQRLVSTSPGLIAATHVLHRLLAPRHPPCALILLIEKNTFCCRYGVFKVRTGVRPMKTASNGRSFKTQQRVSVEVDVQFLEILPRKEVIQPQLPLRLPCYDFTPVTNPTFDGSLPCGLGHRLRVLPASVV